MQFNLNGNFEKKKKKMGVLISWDPPRNPNQEHERLGCYVLQRNRMIITKRNKNFHLATKMYQSNKNPKNRDLDHIRIRNREKKQRKDLVRIKIPNNLSNGHVTLLHKCQENHPKKLPSCNENLSMELQTKPPKKKRPLCHKKLQKKGLQISRDQMMHQNEEPRN